MSITASGIGSGIDIDGLVRQLLAAEAQPAQLRISQREARLQSRLSAFGQFKSALDQLRSALAGLTSTATFNGRTAQVADETLLTVQADSSAATGSYGVEVLRLAAAHKLASAPVAAATTAVGYGTLTIAAGGTSFDVEITSGAPSLADIRNTINSAPDNTLVTATLVTANGGQ
jgi:flagellar hook-associated protein 2